MWTLGRDGNRIRISAKDSGGSLPLEGSGGIEVTTERNKQLISLETPLILKENIQSPLLDLENIGGPVLKASRGNYVVNLLASEGGATIYAKNGSNSHLFLGEQNLAARFGFAGGINVGICDQSQALFASHAGHGTSASLCTSNAGLMAVASPGSVAYAGLFYGPVQIEGNGRIKGDLHLDGAFRGSPTFESKGSGAVLMNLNTDRNWHLRQFGSGAGAALELASIGGGGNKNFLINTNGLVGIGTTAPRDKLHVNGGISATAFNQASSRRWKKDIQKIEGALALVDQLRGVTYRWKADDRSDIGLIAEEVGAVLPEIVEFEENGIDARSVDYTSLVPLLIEAIKEQQAQINTLQAQIAK